MAVSPEGSQCRPMTKPNLVLMSYRLDVEESTDGEHLGAWEKSKSSSLARSASGVC